MSSTYQSLTTEQVKALAFTPKVTSLLSIAGVIYIFLKIFASNRLNRPNRPETVYNRLLLGLSLADFIYAFASFLSTWPIPKDNIYSASIWGEMGNQTTCDIQGFLHIFGGLYALMYTCSLNLYFLLIGRSKWSLERFQRIEPTIHVLCFLYPGAASVVCLLNQMFNPTISGCALQSYPLLCNRSKGVSCIRGTNLISYQLGLVIAPLLAGLTFIVVVTTLLYFHVRKREIDTARLRNDRRNVNNEQSREQFKKACQITVIYVAVSVPTIVSIFAFGLGNDGFIFRILRVSLSPLQGFLNAIVYSRDIEGELIRSIWNPSYLNSMTRPNALSGTVINHLDPEIVNENDLPDIKSVKSNTDVGAATAEAEEQI